MKVRGLFIFLMSAGLLISGITWAQEENTSEHTNNASEHTAAEHTSEHTSTEATHDDHEAAAVSSHKDDHAAPHDVKQEAASAPVEEHEAQAPAAHEEQPAQESAPAPQAEAPQHDEEQPAQEAAPAPAEEAQPAPSPAAPAQEQPAEESTSAESSESPAELQVEVPMPPDELMGLDTVDLEDPQGNWLFKRVWWERAEQKYEKIRAVVTHVMEQRSGFFTQRADLDKNVLDPFYIAIGFKLGELLQKVTDSIEALKAQTEVQPADTKEFETLEENKKELESLKTEVETVLKQDEAVDKALLQFVDQINKLRHYEQQAWQDFKDIARVLDDKKARELFYKIDNAWQNIQKVQEYVEQTFSSSFEKLVADVSKQIERIKSDVAELKERGIVLHITKQVEGEQDEQEEHEEHGFFGSIFEAITRTIRDVVHTIISVIRWPYDLIFGGNNQAQESEPEAETAMPAEFEKSVEAEGAQEADEPIQDDTAQLVEEPAVKKLPVVPTTQIDATTPVAPEVNADEVAAEPQEPQEEQVVEMQDLEISPESELQHEGDQEPVQEQPEHDSSQENEIVETSDTE